jgi:MFS superfamily sulfate permease-like transporter
MRHNESLFDFADWLTEPPAGGPIQMWTVGAVLASVVSGYGLLCCITQRATTLNITMRGFRSLGHGLWLDISGVHAVTFGLLFTCIGLFIHFQWFWGNHKRLFPYHELAKYGAVVGVIVAMIVHVFTMIARTKHTRHEPIRTQ